MTVFATFRALPPVEKRITLLCVNAALLLVLFLMAKVTPLAFLLFILFLVAALFLGINTFFSAVRHKKQWPALLAFAYGASAGALLFGIINSIAVMGIC